MSFVAAGAFAGLVLLVPLVLLHLRQRSQHVREVPSLLLWHEFQLDEPRSARRLGLPPLPLALALQALALILLVLALAAPALDETQGASTTVVVLDDSYWMHVPGTLASAKREADRALGTAPAGSQVRLVLADAEPSLLYSGTVAGARAALGEVGAGARGPDLSAALALAAKLLRGPHDRVVVIHAAQDQPPQVRATPGELRTLTAQGPRADQGIFAPSTRCGIGSRTSCEVFATVANTAPRAVEDRVVADVPGRPAVALSVRVAANSSAPLELLADPGEHVSLRLSNAGSAAGAGPETDALSSDDQAWVTVPGADNIARDAVVTVVGTPADAGSIAQAFAAVPGVTLRLQTPVGYRASDARTSDLVVFDGALPDGARSHGALPPAPAVLLIDPAALPGGRVRGAQADPSLSGSDAASSLLAGADLSALVVNRGAARRLQLPRWLAPVLWSPSGPLLAAGDDGHARLAVMAFEPAGSNLAQLAGFPVLAANLVRWALGWAPASAQTGTPISVDALPGARTVTLQRDGKTIARARLAGHPAALQAPAPGIYTLAETGPGVSHRTTVDVNLASPLPASPSPAATDLRNSRLRPDRASRTPLTGWLMVAALVVLALEWAYWLARRERVPV